MDWGDGWCFVMLSNRGCYLGNGWCFVMFINRWCDVSDRWWFIVFVNNWCSSLWLEEGFIVLDLNCLL